MSNTELYYAQLTDLSVRIAAGIKNRRDPLDELTQALTQLSQTNAIKGNAADAMKAYISEVHMTLLQTLQLILFNYQAALGKYVTGYLEVDSDENFKLIEEDFDAHEHNLSSHRSDFMSIGKKLKAISDEAEDIISLSGAGSKRLFNVADEMDAMKKTVSDLKDKWNSYEDKEQGFDDVQDLIAQTTSLLKNTLSVPYGYSYSPGSFSKLMSKDFIEALQVNARYAHDNQKAFKANWRKICKDYKVDQKRMAEAMQKEANRHKGAWEVVFGIGAVVLGVAAIVLTAGAATPLVAVAWTAGASAGAYGLSNVFEGSQIMVTGADKAFNPLRDTLFKGNQRVYDNFGNVAMFAAGSVIPVGAALKAGQPVFRAVIGGVGRTSVTTAVGVGTNFVVAPIATNLAKSVGIDPIWAKDIGIGTGFAASIFTGREVYKGSDRKYTTFGEMSEEDGLRYQTWNKTREAGIDQNVVNDIVLTNKGLRPDVASYVSKDYIDAHLAQFNDGITVIQTEYDFNRFSKANGFVGIPEDNSLFVLPKSLCDDIAAKANGDISVWEGALGFDIGYLSDGGGLVRIDASDVGKLNLRLPSGNEYGANPHWLPGGFTDSNTPEAISDIIPLSDTEITHMK